LPLLLIWVPGKTLLLTDLRGGAGALSHHLPGGARQGATACSVVAEECDLDSNSACLPGSGTGLQAVLPGWRRWRAAAEPGDAAKEA